MQTLIDYARREKFIQLFGDVFADNAAMLKMCRDLGFKIEVQPGDATVNRVTLDLVESSKPSPRFLAAEKA